MPEPPNIANQFLPGFNNPQMGAPMNYQDQAMAILSAKYGQFRQPPQNFSYPSFGTQIAKFMGGFGEMGAALTPFANQMIGGWLGTMPSNMPALGGYYDPGRFILGRSMNKQVGTRYPPISLRNFDVNAPTSSLAAIGAMADTDSLFRSIYSVTGGFAEFSGSGDEGKILAARTAADITNFARNTHDPIARMLMQGLGTLGVEDELALAPGVTSVANQYLGRTRFNNNFGTDLAEGLRARIMDKDSDLNIMGFRDTGSMLKELTTRNLLDIGDINLQGSLDRNDIDELQKRAISQVEDIAAIFKAGKEIGLSVKDTLTTFQAFTGGTLNDQLKDAENRAIAGFKPGQGIDLDEAVSEARRATSEQIAHEFRVTEAKAALVGTDMTTLLSTSVMGAAQLEQLGIRGGQTAIMDEILAISHVAMGTGATSDTIAKMATGRTALLAQSPEGKAAAVLKNAVAKGILDPTNAGVRAALDKFEQTGELNLHDVYGAFKASGYSQAEYANMITDRNIQQAQSDPGVMADVTGVMTQHGKYSFRQTITRGVLRGLKGGEDSKGFEVNELLAGVGIDAAEFADIFYEGFGKNDLSGRMGEYFEGDDLKTVMAYTSFLEQDALSRSGYDNIENARLRAKADLVNREDLTRSASTQVAVTGMLADIAVEVPIINKLMELNINGMDEDLARRLAGDPDAMARLLAGEEIDGTTYKLNNAQREALQEIGSPAHRQNMLEKVGEALRSGKGLTEILTDYIGVDRKQVVREIQSRFLKPVAYDAKGDPIYKNAEGELGELNIDALKAEGIMKEGGTMVNPDVDPSMLRETLANLGKDLRIRDDAKTDRESIALESLNLGRDKQGKARFKSLDEARLHDYNEGRGGESGLEPYKTIEEAEEGEAKAKKTVATAESAEVTATHIVDALEPVLVKLLAQEMAVSIVDSIPLHTIDNTLPIAPGGNA